MLLEGLHIPLTTPFHPDGRLNAPKLAANVARYSRTPAAGLIALGPNGEPTLLSDDETREVLRTVAEAAAPEKVLIAGVSRDSVRATLELAAFAASLSYDAVFIGVPGFLAPEAGHSRLDSDQRPIPLSKQHSLELRTFFQTIADRSPLPVVLLTEPGRTIVGPIARSVASHPNVLGFYLDRNSLEIQTGLIRGLLEDTANKKREVTVTPTFAAVTARMKLEAAARSAAALVSATSLVTGAAPIVEPPVSPLRTRTKAVGFQILCANVPIMLDALNTGAVGIAPAFAAAAPQACYEVYAAWKDGDQPLASEKQQRLLEPARLCESPGPATLKFGADLNGYFGGLPRLPHLPPIGEQKAAIERLMKEVRN